MGYHQLTVPGQQGRESLPDYLRRGGYRWLDHTGGDEIIVQVKQAGLRGRGGSGRGAPVAEKWLKVKNGRRGTRYLVANGAETSPGSKKDRYLMELYPHRILDGVLAGAKAVGAEVVYLYIKATADTARTSMETALAELTASGLMPPDCPAFEVFRAPETAVSGEDTAICDAIDGFSGQPQVKPPTPETSGILGRPTLISNVETFAAVAVILRDGPQTFRSAGLPHAPGTILVTLSGDVHLPGVYEVPLGIPLQSLVDHYGGGAKGPIEAVLPGGFRSGPLTAGELTLPLDYDSLHAAGTTLGLSHVIVLAQPATLSDLLVGALDLAVTGSCKQCAICAEGTVLLRSLVGRIADGEEPGPLREEIAALSHIYHEKGNCKFLTGVAMLTRRSVLAFPIWREEVTTHGSHR